MSLDIAPIGPVSFSAAPDPARRRSRAAEHDRFTASGDVPASPPPEVLAAMDAAARCYEELQEQGRELRFGVEDGRITVEVRDLDGTVLRRIPASELLDVATGGPLE